MHVDAPVLLQEGRKKYQTLLCEYTIHPSISYMPYRFSPYFSLYLLCKFTRSCSIISTFAQMKSFVIKNRLIAAFLRNITFICICFVQLFHRFCQSQLLLETLLIAVAKYIRDSNLIQSSDSYIHCTIAADANFS